tara:strand:+ start:33 stop:947 length:915 start_codon:yes stop_codon:yes gene_type:complete
VSLLGEFVNNLLQSPIFSSLEGQLNNVCEAISSANLVQLMAPADLDGVLALAQLEASFLDNSLHYRRRVLPPRRHVARDHIQKLPEVDGLIIHIDPFHETQNLIEIDDKYIHIFPLAVELEFESSEKAHHGALDCVAICSALASIMAPDGARVRKQRSMTIAGCWLRQGMDSNYDPVMSVLRDHLDLEGSIDVRPLPEVVKPAPGMIPGLAERMLKRLAKGWPEMDVEARSAAISELILPALREDGMSTMRIEELVWHRAVIPGAESDIASQLYLAGDNWPDDVDKARVHASSIADSLIINGHL